MNSNGQDFINHKLEEAKHYINYGIKEGYFDEEQFEGMSDEELIAFATDASARGDNEAEAQLEQQEALDYDQKENEATGN